MDIVVGLAELALFGAAFWLLPKYLERRVGEAARGAVDVSVGKVLADYNHDLERQLEKHRSTLTAELERVRQALALDRERYSRDYALFATRRNEVYAETFGALQKAIGGYASHFAIFTTRRDYSRSPEADLRSVAERLELVTAAEKLDLVAALDSDLIQDARTLATTLYERDEVRQAQFAFRDFKRLWVLHALYFSPTVDDVLRESVQHLAVLSTYADELIEERPVQRVNAAESLKKVDSTNAQLRTLMRAELQAGFSAERLEK